ncbi:MAG: oligosaccharide flippase family protein [Alistipes sp.]|nr:oligosaccharide flippase family protein [Alistipes sp.]
MALDAGERLIRTSKLNRNAVGSIAIKLSTMIIEIIKVNILLSYLSVEYYGIWLTIVSIVMWSHHFDLGLGTGLKYKLTEAIANQDSKRGKYLVSTAYFSLSLIMSVVYILISPIIFSLNWCDLLNTTALSSKELSITIWCVFTIFISQFVLELISIVLKAFQRTAISEIYKPIGNVISLCIIIIIGKFSNNSLLLASLSMTIPYIAMLLFANLYYFCGIYRNIRPSLSYFKRAFVKEIYSLGVKFFINQLTAFVVFSTANFILSNIINPSEVSVYSTANTYYNLVVIFFTSIIVAASTPITDAYVKDDMEWVKNCMSKLFKIACLGVILEVLLFLVSGFAFDIWLDNKIVVPTGLALTFVLYNILALYSQQYSLFLASVGKMNLNVIISCVKLVIFIPIAMFMVKKYGSIGLLVSIIAINTIPNLVFGAVQTHKIINKTATGIWNK